MFSYIIFLIHLTLSYYFNKDDYYDSSRVSRFVVEAESNLKNDTNTEIQLGDTAEFGNYPQTKITDTDIIGELNSLLTSANPASDYTSRNAYDYF